MGINLTRVKLDDTNVFSPLQMALRSHWNCAGWNQCNMCKYEGDHYYEFEAQV